MKQELNLEIRNSAWKYAWKEWKAKYTMREIADVFGAKLPNFFRIVKDETSKVGVKINKPKK